MRDKSSSDRKNTRADARGVDNMDTYVLLLLLRVSYLFTEETARGGGGVRRGMTCLRRGGLNYTFKGGKKLQRGYYTTLDVWIWEANKKYLRSGIALLEEVKEGRGEGGRGYKVGSRGVSKLLGCS